MARTSTQRDHKSDNDSQITLNLPGDWVDDAEAVATAMSRPGLAVTRADALRIALRKGLDDLMREHGRTPKKR
ncbi:MAG: hypothetical protein ACRENE_26295 [Polyangiaceae bacterium]